MAGSDKMSDYEGSQQQGSQQTVECTDLAEKLLEIQQQMEQDIADLEYQKRKKTNSAANFKELEKIVGEVDTIVSAYSNARENLKKGLDKQDNYYCKKRDMILAAVGHHESKIKEAIEACKTQISDLETDVATKKTENEATETLLKTSQLKLVEKTACFNQWKDRKTNTETIISLLNQLQGQIENQELESKFSVMYYLLFNKFHEELSKFKNTDGDCKIDPIVESDDEFKNGLTAAWCEMHDARKEVLKNQDDFDESARMLETAETDLQTAVDNLDSNIIQKMEEIDVNCFC